ncbi:hypothetical protein AAMO2058_000233900 [Amorphochlora amoebiformis]
MGPTSSLLSLLFLLCVDARGFTRARNNVARLRVAIDLRRSMAMPLKFVRSTTRCSDARRLHGKLHDPSRLTVRSEIEDDPDFYDDLDELYTGAGGIYEDYIWDDLYDDGVSEKSPANSTEPGEKPIESES